MSKRWYIVHAYSGFEKQVMRSLQERIKRTEMEHFFGDVLVPTEEVVEIKNGVKRKSERKFFPGYVLVNMEMNDDSWHLVKDCPKVMGFIGGKADKPAPISDKEADAILNRLRQMLMRHVLKPCLSRVKWCVLLMGLLLTLMAWLKKSLREKSLACCSDDFWSGNACGFRV
jgi:transcription antitermination factor NusG